MEADVCYICYEPATAESPFCKPSPCLCKGSIHIHNHCLVTLRRGSANNCGICKSEYSTTSPGFYKFDEKTSTIEFINDKLLRHVYKVTGDQLIHGPMHVYYPSGRLQAIYEYIYGEINGVVKVYFDNDHSQLKQIVRYIAGKMAGELLLYEADGRLKKRLYYKDGLLHGPVYIYEKDQKKFVLRYFSNGVEVGGLPASVTTVAADIADDTTTTKVTAPGPEYDPLAGILITN